MSIQNKVDAAVLHVLDRAGWNSLSGPHSHIAEVHGLARRYPVDVSPFNAVADEANPGAWADLHELIGADGVAIVVAKEFVVPNGWELVEKFPGVQMSGEEVIGVSDPDLIPLTNADVPEMLELVARTQPGPFLPRTIELGGYLGIRVEGKLVAMAGRRLNPPGWVEISAVCTDAEHRGRGFAARLVLAVAAGIQESGQVPFLHTGAGNENAIRLYEKLGFKIRLRGEFNILKPIAKSSAGEEI
jgi:ribosomal protein S18 acetylase RimI-like enzyme